MSSYICETKFSLRKIFGNIIIDLQSKSNNNKNIPEEFSSEIICEKMDIDNSYKAINTKNKFEIKSNKIDVLDSNEKIYRFLIKEYVKPLALIFKDEDAIKKLNETSSQSWDEILENS